MSKKAGIAVFTAVILIAAAIAMYITAGSDTFQSSYVVMDTVVSINITGKNAKETGKEIFHKLQDFENKNSLFVEGSDISKINNEAGKTYVQVNSETYDLVKRAYDLCQESAGKFDITIAPIVLAWDVTGDNPRIPQIDSSLLTLVNYQDVLFNESEKSIMLKHSGQKIDLGGIAKGSSCDKILEILNNRKIKEAAVSVGGNIIAHGNREYNVGIEHPRTNGDLIASVKLKNKIVSTSGDYRRYFEMDGVRYHHIIDPKTGYPYNSDFYSVTVIGESGALGDYMSTRLFMTPKEELIPMLNSYDIIAIGKDNVIYASPGLDLQLLDSNFAKYNG